MKNTARKTTAILLSLSFFAQALVLRYPLLGMAPGQAPTLVLAELCFLALMGAGVVLSWRETEPFTQSQKRSFAAVYGLYLCMGVLCFGMEQQLVSSSLSTISPLLTAPALVWLVLAAKFLLPAAAVYTACRMRGRSTVTFEKAPDPAAFGSEEALEQLTVQLDDAEVRE